MTSLRSEPRRLQRSSRPERRHGPLAQLLIAWSPLSVILVVYAAAQWLNAPLDGGRGARSNRLGFDLHVTGPARVDADAFGSVPTTWLQHQLVDGTAHWYDAAAALVYVTHFVSIPVVTALVWFRLRDRFRAWITSVLVLVILGIGGYVVYPAAPPWLAAQRGEIGPVHRISALGWDYLHLGSVGWLTSFAQGRSNPVAAMPSLHAGVALLIALFAWPTVGASARVALLGYALLMALTLVYTGEHYVVDVAAGWVTAGIAAVVGPAVAHRFLTPAGAGP